MEWVQGGHKSLLNPEQSVWLLTHGKFFEQPERLHYALQIQQLSLWQGYLKISIIQHVLQTAVQLMLKTTDQTAAPIIHQPGDQDEFTFIFWFMWTGYYSNNDHLCIVKILVATNSHNMTIDTKFYSALAIWLTAKLATQEEPAVTVQSLPPQFRQQNQESRDQKK